MNKNLKAIILTRGINGLGAIRSLSVEGVSVVVITDSADDPVMYSKYPIEKIVVGGTIDVEKGILNALGKFHDDSHYLMGTSDEYIDFIVRNLPVLKKTFTILLPPDELVTCLLDKANETKTMEKLGIPIPKTLWEIPTSSSIFLNKMALPVIVKPRISSGMKILGSKNIIIKTQSELEQFLTAHQKNLQHYIVQDIVPGEDDQLWVCNGTFDKDSQLLQAFTFNRLGTTPAHYGVTSYAISRKNDEIKTQVRHIGKSFNYVGPLMVEFKFDSRDNSYKYIEINPRIGMCNIFDTRCGINNVFASYQIATGGNLPVTDPLQKNGVIFINLFGDISSRLKDGKGLGKIISLYASNMFRNHVHAYWYIYDPMPSMRIVLKSFKRLFKFLSN